MQWNEYINLKISRFIVLFLPYASFLFTNINVPIQLQDLDIWLFPLVFSIRVYHCCLRCMITAGFEYSIAKITPKTTIFCCCFDCRLFLRLCCFYAHLLFLLQTVRKHKFTAHAMTKKWFEIGIIKTFGINC